MILWFWAKRLGSNDWVPIRIVNGMSEDRDITAIGPMIPTPADFHVEWPADKFAAAIVRGLRTDNARIDPTDKG